MLKLGYGSLTHNPLLTHYRIRHKWSIRSDRTCNLMCLCEWGKKSYFAALVRHFYVFSLVSHGFWHAGNAHFRTILHTTSRPIWCTHQYSGHLTNLRVVSWTILTNNFSGLADWNCLEAYEGVRQLSDLKGHHAGIPFFFCFCFFQTATPRVHCV